MSGCMKHSTATKEQGELLSLKLDELPDYLTVPEAAAVLRVGKRVIYEMVKRKELADVVHIGPKRITRIPAESIRKLAK